ncbi:unnamed protein product [Durusdinium trenchii]|uniref:C3H1-type domain-containing protein n=1 Tax=Durusdinium trenchii TaxID=1381693 RepID=A0ABP0JUZ8_9DINO
MEAADSQGDPRLHLQVKNTFLDVQTHEEMERRYPRMRSKSWDGSTSSSNSCSGTGDSDMGPEQYGYGAYAGYSGLGARQEPPQDAHPGHHWVVQENSSSASVSDSAGETAQSYRDFMWELERGQRDAGIPVPREAQQAPEVKATPQSEPDADDDFQPEYGQSVGSKGHGRGKCTPCTRVLVRPGCEYGARCMFCHLEHSSQTDTKKSRHRPCKAARQQYKQTIQKIAQEYKDKPEQKQKALGKIADASPYMRSLLKGMGEAEDGDEGDVQASQAETLVARDVALPTLPWCQRRFLVMQSVT